MFHLFPIYSIWLNSNWILSISFTLYLLSFKYFKLNISIMDYNTVTEDIIRLTDDLNTWSSTLCIPVKDSESLLDISSAANDADWNGTYSASSSSVRTRRFIEHTFDEYNDGNANWYIALNTHFWAEGIIVRLTGSVSPDEDRTAATNSSRFCRFVPWFKLNISEWNKNRLKRFVLKKNNHIKEQQNVVTHLLCSP